MTRRTLTILAETRDVGGTQHVILSLGDAIIGRYQARTRYPDRAIQDAEVVLAQFINQAMLNAGYEPGIDPYEDD